MEWFGTIDWARMFLPQTPLLETLLRGSVVYLALFFLIRVVLQRQAGTVGITDLLVLVLIADAAQNAMADDYHSLPDGILLVATLVFWNLALEWLGYRFPKIELLIHPPPLPLVKNGKMLRRNMKRELISEEELWSHLREEGIENIEEVKQANLEGDGKISVVKNEKPKSAKRGKKKGERPAL